MNEFHVWMLNVSNVEHVTDYYVEFKLEKKRLIDSF